MGHRDQVDADRYNHFVCPTCGGEVRVGSAGCPHCGSDERTGWGDAADENALDLPGGYGGDESFDYERFVQQEFGGPKRTTTGFPRGFREVLLGVAATLIAVALLYAVLTL